MHHRAKDITGLRVGYLTALRYHGSDGKHSLWVVRCDCGVEKLMDPSEYKRQGARGIQASCGCKRRETIGARKITHGMTKHPAYAVWRSMLARCLNPQHKAWPRYGGRGIEVCDRWQESFENFWADMGPTYQSGLSLDREENNAGYTPLNCRWVTDKVQANNTRVNVAVAGTTAALLAEQLGVKRSTMYYRLSVGVPVERLGEAPDVSRRFSTS